MQENSHAAPSDSDPVPMSNKEHIANLSRMVACFCPVFVNESGQVAPYSVAANPKRAAEWKWKGMFAPRPGVEKVPTMDDLLNTCAGAVMGMREFIAEYETARAKLEDVLPKHGALTTDAMMAHQASMRKGVSKPSLSECMDTWIGRFLQAIDVFKQIYETDLSQTDPGLAAERFQAISHAFVAHFITPAFLKSIGGGLPPESPLGGLPATPPPLAPPQSDGGGDAGENPDLNP